MVREPWEAQAFAMALALHERGVFTWPEWAATLGAEVSAGDQFPGSDQNKNGIGGSSVFASLGGDIGAYQAKPVAPTAAAIAGASVDEKKLATLLTAVSAYAQDDATCGAKAGG